MGYKLVGILLIFKISFANLNEIENYVMVDTYSNLFTRWITFFNKGSGVEQTRKSIIGEVVEMGLVNNSLCFILIQKW